MSWWMILARADPPTNNFVDTRLGRVDNGNVGARLTQLEAQMTFSRLRERLFNAILDWKPRMKQADWMNAAFWVAERTEREVTALCYHPKIREALRKIK